MTIQAFSGGCLCGGVRYRYDGELGGEIGTVTVCHCAQCRKGQGFASAVAPAEAAKFEVTAGADLIREYESSPGKMRAFCSVCGSPIYSRRPAQSSVIRLRLGSLDQPPEYLRVEAHIYAADLPAWAEPNDALRYPGLEPGRK